MLIMCKVLLLEPDRPYQRLHALYRTFLLGQGIQVHSICSEDSECHKLGSKSY